MVGSERKSRWACYALAAAAAVAGVVLPGCADLLHSNRINHFHDDRRQQAAADAQAALKAYTDDPDGFGPSSLAQLNAKSEFAQVVSDARVNLDDDARASKDMVRTWANLHDNFYKQVGLVDNAGAVFPDANERFATAVAMRLAKVGCVSQVYAALVKVEAHFKKVAEARVEKLNELLKQNAAVAGLPGELDSIAKAAGADQESTVALAREFYDAVVSAARAYSAAPGAAAALNSAVDPIREQIRARIEASRDPNSARALVPLLYSGLGEKDFVALDAYLDELHARLRGNEDILKKYEAIFKQMDGQEAGADDGAADMVKAVRDAVERLSAFQSAHALSVQAHKAAAKRAAGRAWGLALETDGEIVRGDDKRALDAVSVNVATQAPATVFLVSYTKAMAANSGGGAPRDRRDAAGDARLTIRHSLSVLSNSQLSIRTTLRSQARATRGRLRAERNVTQKAVNTLEKSLNARAGSAATVASDRKLELKGEGAAGDVRQGVRGLILSLPTVQKAAQANRPVTEDEYAAVTMEWLDKTLVSINPKLEAALRARLQSAVDLNKESSNPQTNAARHVGKFLIEVAQGGAVGEVDRMVAYLLEVLGVETEVQEENLRHIQALAAIADLEMSRWKTLGKLASDVTESYPSDDTKLFLADTGGFDFMAKNPEVLPPAHVVHINPQSDRILPSIRMLAREAIALRGPDPQAKGPRTITDETQYYAAENRLQQAVHVAAGFLLMQSVNERSAADNAGRLDKELQEHKLLLHGIESHLEEARFRHELAELLAYHSGGITQQDLAQITQDLTLIGIAVRLRP